MTLNPQVRAAMAKINKEYGEHTVIVGSDMRAPTRITSGSLALDAVLGGGWATNQWHEIIGDPSAGKTATVLKTLAANQAINPDFLCTWIAAEYFDRGYAEMCGVDTERVIVVNENIMERAFAICLQAMGERWSDMLVIDSLPAMTPGDEAEQAMEEFQVGMGARLTNKFLRKQGSAGKRSMVEEDRSMTCFLINQWREKIGVRYGDPRTTPGGKMKDFTCVTRSEVRRDDWIEVGPSSSKVRVGQTIKTRIIKNKTFPPQKVATYDFYFETTPDGLHIAGEYDVFKEIVGLGVVHGVIKQSGAWFEYGTIRTQGLPKMLVALTQDLDAAEVLRKEVLDAATGKPYLAVEDAPEIEDDEEPTPRRRSARKAVAEEPTKKRVARRRA